MGIIVFRQIETSKCNCKDEQASNETRSTGVWTEGFLFLPSFLNSLLWLFSCFIFPYSLANSMPSLPLSHPIPMFFCRPFPHPPFFSRSSAVFVRIRSI
jgi:hypothetical protein